MIETKEILNEQDQKQLNEKGISENYLNWQLQKFIEGVPFYKIDRAATIGDGIIKMNEAELQQNIHIYDSEKDRKKLKFVPASGAASRMFKFLFEYLDSDSEGPVNENLETFFSSLGRFGFYSDLQQVISDNGQNLEDLLKNKEYKNIIKQLLGPEGLEYGKLPKGLLKFHKYDVYQKTPFEEHLYEAIKYAKTKDGAYLHFTVSPEHMEKFKSLFDRVKDNLEKETGVTLEVSFSIQKPSTDTMAVNLDNTPFRKDDGTILFRPGGHGALIDNLNELGADIIFIKNIDNVVPEKLAQDTITYKKALGGKLIELQEKVFSSIKLLKTDEIDAGKLKQIDNFIKEELQYEASQPVDFKDLQKTKEFLLSILDRPMRVCGVVKNEGEPGGGPFWAPNSKGDLSLQIVESSQVDLSDPDQKNTFNSATHFNPVDLVCSPSRYNGEKFDLKKYVNETTCFISSKSKNGKELKALELPGLWNGAMSDWTTVFVEVPVSTFNPVKTVNDLLREHHQ